MIDKINELKDIETSLNGPIDKKINDKIEKFKEDIVRVLIFTPYNHEMGALAIGPSSIYHEINLNPNSPGVADRMFFYDFLYDESGNLKTDSIDILSMEQNLKIEDFDLVALGLTNPGSFFDLLKFFKITGTTKYTKQRPSDYPIILGGGMGFNNPEPYVDYFDGFVLGESEKQFIHFVNKIHEAKLKKTHDWKRKVLDDSNKYQGIYIPDRYVIQYSDDGKINKIITSDIEANVPLDDNLLLSEDNHRYSSQIIIDDTGVIVVNKGCNYTCAFCQLGNLKETSIPFDSIKKAIDKLFLSGINKLIINSPSFTQYQYRQELLDYIGLKKKEHKISDFRLFIGSVRIDEVDEQYIDNLLSFNDFNHTYLKYTNDIERNFIAVAPEFGNERLMKLMRKGLNINNIMDGIEICNKKGIHNFHLYFMVGIETETVEDRKDIARLSKNIYEKIKEKGGKLYLKVNLYIPSAYTLGQRMEMHSTEKYKLYIHDVESELKKILSDKELENVKIITLDEGRLVLESFLMRGSRLVTPIIDYIFDNKIPIESLNYKTIKEIFLKFGLDYDSLLDRIDIGDHLPWSNINQINPHKEQKFNASLGRIDIGDYLPSIDVNQIDPDKEQNFNTLFKAINE